MNKVLNLTNWNKGGQYYIHHASKSGDDPWIGLQGSVIDKMQAKFEDDFYLYPIC